MYWLGMRSRWLDISFACFCTERWSKWILKLTHTIWGITCNIFNSCKHSFATYRMNQQIIDVICMYAYASSWIHWKGRSFKKFLTLVKCWNWLYNCDNVFIAFSGGPSAPICAIRRVISIFWPTRSFLV